MVALRITDIAKKELLKFMESGSLKSPVPSVIWADGYEDSLGNSYGPNWSIGFYERESIKSEPLVEIDGIQFVFGQPWKNEELNGKTLDFRNGKFVVE